MRINLQKGYLIYFIYTLTYLINLNSFAQDFQKTKLDFTPVPDYSAQFEWVDVDNDKDLDALVFKTSSWDLQKSNIRLYENKSGKFEEVINPLGGSSDINPMNYSLGDYDHDGDLDFLIQDYLKLWVALNNGNRSFTLKELPGFAPNVFANTLKWLDVDGDTDLDIVYPNQSWNSIHVYLNHQNTFSLTLHPAATLVRSLTFGDVNNDGLPDFVGAKGNTTSNPVFLYLNKGDGAFEESGAALIPGIREGGKMLWADLDGDQDLDLFLAGSDNKCAIFRNQFIETGKPTFEKAFQLKDNYFPSVDAGDINQDGLTDLVFTDRDITNGRTLLYLNQSTKTTFKFEEKDLNIKTVSQDVDLIDINRDQTLDLFFISREGNTQTFNFELYQTPVTDANFKLPIPGQLVTEVKEDILLSWAPVATLGSVHYNVQLKLNNEIFNNALSLEEGTPLWPQRQDKYFSPNQKINNLPTGTYKWRVQAVDAAGRTSAFSEYNSFTISPAPENLVLHKIKLDKIRLQWAYNGPAGNGFAIFRRSDNSQLKKIASLPAGSLSYEDTDLMANQKYSYLVKADIQGSLSAPSNVVEVETQQFLEKIVPQRPIEFVGTGQALDLDRDEDYDLTALSREFSAQHTHLQNDGTGIFTSKELRISTQDLTQVHTYISRDMDNDGDQDICIAKNNQVVVYENNAGLFQKIYSSSVYGTVIQLALEDFNNDGRLDLLFSHASSNGGLEGNDYKLFLQNKSFSFIQSPSRFIPEFQLLTGRFAVGDLNSDGFLDIIINGSDLTKTKAKVHINQGGNGFSSKDTNITYLYNFWLVDFNLDGNLDIVQGQEGFIGLQVFEGLGDFNFKAVQYIEIPNGQFGNINEIQSADFDLDGNSDLLVSFDSHLTILQYRAPGKYIPLVFTLGVNLGGRSLFTDFDKDGDLDIFHESLKVFFENRIKSTGESLPPGPATPTNIKVAIGQKTKITWSSSAQNASITYNLLIKDSLGKIIVNPETNEGGTFRYRLGPGNAGNTSAYTINDLPAGVYSVQVQAINAGFRLSAFSEPVSFEIKPGPTNLAIERLLLNKIRLNWNQPISGDGEIIVERLSPNADFEIIGRLSAATTTFTDENLKYNKLYKYRVYAAANGLATSSSNIVEWNTSLFVLNANPGLPKLQNIFAKVGDYNNDTRMDLVLYGFPTEGPVWEEQTRIVENTPTGWVSRPINRGSIAAALQLELFDFDGDFKLDIFRFGITGSDFIDKAELQINKGNNVFQTTPSIFTARPQSLLGWWDMDSDNDLDAYMLDSETSHPGTKTILENTTGGNFKIKEAITLTCSTCSERILTADFDRDGDEDLLQATYTSAGGSGYYFMQNNQGKVVQTDVVVSAQTGLEAQVIDYNNDGWPDIFVLGNSYTNIQGKSMLYKNLGLGTNGLPRFIKVQDQLPINNFRLKNDWVDLDNDGDLDFYTSDLFITIFLNEGNDAFSEFRPASLPPFQSQADIFDFDNDGDMDLYLRWSDGVNPQGSVLINQIVSGPNSIHNQAPASPANLTAVQDIDGMHLTWSPATDDLTPSPGLTYDVIIYKDGKSITKASLDPVTGNRQKLAFGRSPSKLLLRNLPIGTYTWKVQAVDASYKGSALSVAGEFLFKPEPPRINDTLIYRCGRQVVLQAKGENIEWFQDADLKTKITAGTFSPQVSQVVYVTQTQEGVRGIPKKVTITIFEKPEKPVLASSNRYTYCSQNAGMTLLFQASGVNIKWYADKDLKNLLISGPQFTAQAFEKSYYVTQTIQNCESLPAEFTISPVMIDTRIIQRQDTLYAAEKNAFSYQWYLNNQVIPLENKNFLKKRQDGTYRVRIVKDNCADISPDIILSIREEQEDTETKVYPNPTSGTLFIHLPEKAKAVEIRITDALGRRIYETNLPRTPAEPFQVPTQKWGKGIYYLYITSNQGKKVLKVFVN